MAEVKKKERPQDRYNREKTTVIKTRFVNATEKDLLDKLASVPNRSGYIKSLIRADIEREKRQD